MDEADHHTKLVNANNLPMTKKPPWISPKGGEYRTLEAGRQVKESEEPFRTGEGSPKVGPNRFLEGVPV